jgi:hypothetical protein
MNPDYPAILNAIRPGTQWTVGETYESLVWLDDSPKPTKKTLDDAWPQVQHDLAVAAIRDQRHARYLAETDPMFMKAQRDEEDGVTMADWKAAVAQVKADLPYPEAPGA